MGTGQAELFSIRVALTAAALALLILPAAASAATYPDGDGHDVRIEAPNLPPDPARDQAYASLLGSFVHSFEMGGLELHLAGTTEEYAQWCGDAGACVSGTTIHLPPDASPHEWRVTLAHEYGHIVHSARLNPPRGSISDGTKRWASYEGICQGLRAGIYGPFDYYKTPREAFAQAYATLNFPDAEWRFDETLRPDAGAFEAIRQDVLEPWQPTRVAFAGKLNRRAPRATHELALPLDGVLSVRLKEKRKLDAKLTLIAAGQKIVKRNDRVEHEVCGERAAVLKVRALDGTRGAYDLVVERP